MYCEKEALLCIEEVMNSLIYDGLKFLFPEKLFYIDVQNV